MILSISGDSQRLSVKNQHRHSPTATVTCTRKRDVMNGKIITIFLGDVGWYTSALSLALPTLLYWMVIWWCCNIKRCCDVKWCCDFKCCCGVCIEIGIGNVMLYFIVLHTLPTYLYLTDIVHLAFRLWNIEKTRNWNTKNWKINPFIQSICLKTAASSTRKETPPTCSWT